MPQASTNALNRNTKAVESSVALVTSVVDGVRTCGTAFCVRANNSGVFLVTCRHVVTDLDTGIGEVRVNGSRAVEIANGDEFGVDMSILSVPGAKFPELPVEPNRSIRTASHVHGVGFRHMHGDHYFTVPVRGRVDRLFTVRKQLSKQGAQSFRVTADKGYEFHPGLSGSPICNTEGAVVGILAFSSQDGSLGYVLAAEAVPKLLPALLPAAKGFKRTDTALEDVPAPPPLPRVKDDLDLQSGRFGGESSDDTVKLTAQLQRKVGKSYFVFDVIVSPIKSGVTIIGPARFYLHDTYPRSMIQVRDREENGSIRLEDIHSYGVYTVGCQVYCSDGKWHSVELDLYEWGISTQLPQAFLSR